MGAQRKDAFSRPPPIGLDADRDGLRGMPAICSYSGYSDDLVLRFVREQCFPAAVIGNKWESSKVLIDNWRREQIHLALIRAAQPEC